jgi:hypothetical protein
MLEITNVILLTISTFFTVVGACATATYTMAFIITLIYLKSELREMRLSTYASTYKSVVDILQTKEVIVAREYILNTLIDRPFKLWETEDRQEAEKVCRSYDAIGQIVRHKFIPKEYIIDS